jgi:hypothetical protein
MTLEFAWQVVEEYEDIKFHGNPLIGSWDIPWGLIDRQTDGQHDEANSRFTQFTERV